MCVENNDKMSAVVIFEFDKMERDKDGLGNAALTSMLNADGLFHFIPKWENKLKWSDCEIFYYNGIENFVIIC